MEKMSGVMVLPNAGLKRRRRKAQPVEIMVFLALLVVGLVMIYPFVFMVLTSFQSADQYLAGWGFSLDTWNELIRTTALGRQVLNSVFITVSAIALILVCASAAGYALAKLPYKGHHSVFLIIVACMMVPAQSIIIPLYVNFAGLNLINNYLSAILAYAALGLPFGTFLMTSFFRGLPDELIEAGMCDGLGHIQSFFRLALPLGTPGLAAVAVLQFILIWNDLLVGLLFLQTPDVRTITVGLGVLTSGNLSSLPLLMAGSVLSAIPSIAVYAFFQKYLIAGLTVGASR